MITVKIDYGMIKKEYLYTSEKTKKVYLDLALFEYEEGKSKYEDTHYVIQSTSKEVRDQMKLDGTRLPIIGNAKDRDKKQERQSPRESGMF